MDSRCLRKDQPLILVGLPRRQPHFELSLAVSLEDLGCGGGHGYGAPRPGSLWLLELPSPVSVSHEVTLDSERCPINICSLERQGLSRAHSGHQKQLPQRSPSVLAARLDEGGRLGGSEDLHFPAVSAGKVRELSRIPQ